MKNRGTSFFAFPSAASDLNLANYNDFYNLNFTKFILLNIPRQETSEPPINGVMDFIPKRNTGENSFYCDDPNYLSPNKLSDQLVESLRNYVANYDTTLHESRINSNTDFYNVGERYTPTEQIFWKWCRKLNLIDLEPAVHKVDWDKNLSDFDNSNNSTVTNLDYFRKYLWKEREVYYYRVSAYYESGIGEYSGSLGIYNTPKFIINETAKFKKGDKIYLTGVLVDEVDLSGKTNPLNYGTSYTIGEISFESGSTIIWLDTDFNGSGEGILQETYIYLNYKKLVQYVGEINQITNIQTASRVGQEVTAYVPHHAGKTPTILFGTRENTNYYPNLEVPILPNEIQTEIIGTESLNSPIRTNPQDYPGSYFGQFDTEDNTYLCSNGDSIRYQGDYYGVKVTDNAGLNAEDYVEKLVDFNADSIDGVFLDFNRNHYYKMNIPGLESQNFDEFSSISIQGQAPEDFEFNAILWYYELIERDQNNNVNSYINLYGIEFLNNPDNDDDNFATLITPYKKLVTNGSQDGLSYMFNINLHYNIDNDVEPLTYDPSTIYNMFGFDMYNEMMKRYYRVNENFVNIIQEFVRMNLDVQEMKSLIYSQTDMDDIKNRMRNMEKLLEVYSRYQFADSDTAKISMDYTDVYPRLKINVVSVEYDEIKNISLTEAFNYNLSTSGTSSYPIALSYTSKMLLRLINDNSYNDSGTVTVLLDRDLGNKQKLDIVIKPEFAQYSQRLLVNMLFNKDNVKTEVSVFEVDLPKDLTQYIEILEEATYDDSYYLNENIYVNTLGVLTGTSWCGTGSTEIILTENLFRTGNTVYIQNLYFIDTSGNTVDYSGAYPILSKSGTTITIDLQVYGYRIVGQPRVSYYRGIEFSILRVNGSNSSTFEERYELSYKII